MSDYQVFCSERYQAAGRYPLKAKRKRATQRQLDVLTKTFEANAFPSTELRNALARELGMAPRTVQIWFQNRRQACRQQSQQVVEERVLSTKRFAQDCENARVGYAVNKITTAKAPAHVEVTKMFQTDNIWERSRISPAIASGVDDRKVLGSFKCDGPWESSNLAGAQRTANQYSAAHTRFDYWFRPQLSNSYMYSDSSRIFKPGEFIRPDSGTRNFAMKCPPSFHHSSSNINAGYANQGFDTDNSAASRYHMLNKSDTRGSDINESAYIPHSEARFEIDAEKKIELDAGGSHQSSHEMQGNTNAGSSHQSSHEMQGNTNAPAASMYSCDHSDTNKSSTPESRNNTKASLKNLLNDDH